MGTGLPAFDDDNWELYDTTTDWSQAHDLAEQHPERLHQLQRLFLIEATKYNVLPMDDRRVERFNSDLAGRPTLIKGSSQILYGGMTRLSENAVINIKNKSHSVTAEVAIPDGGGQGVIIAQGGAFGGWALYLIDGVPRYCYNVLGLQRFTVVATAPVPSGTHQVRTEFTYDDGGLGKGAAPSPSTWTALPWATDGLRRQFPCSSRPMRPPTSASTPPHRSATTTRRRRACSTAPSTGCRSTSARTTTTTSSLRSSDCGSP
jgi:hypothetical protein